MESSPETICECYFWVNCFSVDIVGIVFLVELSMWAFVSGLFLSALDNYKKHLLEMFQFGLNGMEDNGKSVLKVVYILLFTNTHYSTLYA